MAFAVVNYPTLSEEDFEWIQSVRREHDVLYYDVVEPHLSLVFPIEEIDAPTILEHVRRQARSIAPFEVIFRCAILGDPDFENHAHAFLVPDEGFSDVVRLHDRLYTGPLSDFLRLDLPFIPHVGIANTPEAEGCKALIEELNAEPFEIRGRVAAVDVVEYDGTTVQTVKQFPLSGESTTEDS